MYLLFTYMARYVMACNIHYEGHWKGRALKMETFLGPEMATSEVSVIWARKSLDFQGPPLPMPRVMDVTRLKTIKYKRHIKKQVH
jgi:hypothetical protein